MEEGSYTCTMIWRYMTGFSMLVNFNLDKRNKT